VTRAFGEEFFSLLTQWVPMNITAIHMAEMLVDKAEKFRSPLPPLDSKYTRVVEDPKLSWQMGVKLIELTQQHLQSLLRMSDLGADGTGQEHHASPLDLATRYCTTATRELERAVRWYQYLKELKL
jgi:hypothetical protein